MCNGVPIANLGKSLRCAAKKCRVPILKKS